MENDNKLTRMFGMKFKDIDEALDFIEMKIVENYDLMEFPVDHTFTPGLYGRTIVMPAGSLLTSKIHKTEHQFVILKGAAMVLDGGGEWQLLEAGHHGITKPGTRRLLFIVDDCVWKTFHPTERTTPEEVEADIIEKRDNQFIGDIQKLVNA